MDDLFEGCASACGQTIGSGLVIYVVIWIILYAVFNLGVVLTTIISTVIFVGGFIGYAYLDSSEHSSFFSQKNSVKTMRAPRKNKRKPSNEA